MTASLVGVTYKVRPVKGAIGISLAQEFKGGMKKGGKNGSPEQVQKINKVLDRVINMMFVEKSDRDDLRDRMQDPDDLLDFAHIFELMEKLTEAQSGNPTTSPSAS